MVGVHVRERQLGGGTSDSLAIRLRYRAQRQRVLAFQRLHPEHFDLGAATDHLDRADSLLAESQRRDPRWDVPLLERAAQSEPRAALVLSADGADAAGVERAFDEGIAHVDDLLKRNPDHAAALAWRGRLRWQRIGFGRAYTDASVDSAVRDLETALQRDPSLAWAAATLSEIHYTARGDFLEALDWARLAYRHDTYAENLTHTLGRMALSHFELMQEDSATHWCREGLRRDPGNPAPRGCLLEVMAWGTGPALPDAAWIHYDAILDRAAMGNLSELRSYYGMVVAGVIARAGLRDSARAVLARARAGMDPRAEAALLAPELLGLEAAVLFRLDEPESARRRLEEYARRSPRMAELAMARRLLREYVRPPADRPHR
jgi:tetratricopeptide (TPR) repeat protein